MVELGLRHDVLDRDHRRPVLHRLRAAPAHPNWGTMINENRIGLTLNPWAAIAPAT